jgi:hypothetical protein
VEFARDQLRLRLHQEVGQPVVEPGVRERELLHCQTAQRIEAQVFTRAQDLDEVALVEQQRAFVLLHMKLAKHFCSPFFFFHQ